MIDMSCIPHLSRVLVFKRFVMDLATLSKCEDRQVAAIITDKELTQVYSIGINGGPKGQADCLCVTDGKYSCLHAEVNALIKCRSDANDKVMFTTLEPCKTCAAAIINAPGSFRTVYYIEAWKHHQGIELLQNAGIGVYQI